MLPKYTKGGNLFLNVNNNSGVFSMADRIKFTKEQLSQIKTSDDFKAFQENDSNITLDTYLANEKNYALWAEMFSAEKPTQSIEEIFAEEDLEASMDMGREGGPRNEGYVNETPAVKVEKKPAKKMTGVVLEDKKPSSLTVDEQEALDEIGKENLSDLTPSEKGEFEKALHRIRSLHSNQNQDLFDVVTVEILHDMKEISDDDFNILLNNPHLIKENAAKADSLSKENTAKFKVRLAEKVAANPELLNVTPPDVLTQSYETLQQFIEVNKKKNPKADLTAYEANLATISGRMDTLSDNMEANVDVFFNDRTNIADTYQAYMDMFAAREKDLAKSNDDADKQKVEKIESNRKTLDMVISGYDEEWNLSGLDEKDADRINRRFDAASGFLPELKLNDETLALVSKYQFLDEAGKVTPQFIDPKDGSLHEKWSKGLDIAPEGKLAKVVSLAANDELLKTIGSKEDFNKQSLENGLNDNLPFKLFAIHNSEELIKGVAENPNKFTDPKYAQKFVQDLANSEKPMQISETGYQAGVKAQDNAIQGYTQRLGQKIGNDKPVLGKLGATMSNQESLPEFRKRMAGNVLKRGLTSFGMATVFTVGTKAIGAKFGATAATAVGVGIGVGATAYMLYKRKKQAKKNGEKYGWKEFKKDRALQIAIATSTLAGATAFCSMTGQTELAATLGTAAIVVGSGGSALEGYTQSRKAGASQLESIMWGGAMAAATYGGAQMGRMAGNAAVDAYNRAFGDNEIFQQKNEVTHSEEKTEVVYKEGVVDGAKNILQDNWYKADPDLLQQRVDAINQYNIEHGTNIDPHRYLLAAHDAGALTPDNNLLHVQGGPDVNTAGNHKVFGAEWSNSTGVSQGEVSSLASSVGGQGINITPESIEAFNKVDNFISANNQVGSVPSNPHQNDGVLGFNSTNEGGVTRADANGNQYSTYANHGGVHDSVTTTTTTTETNFTQNEGATAIWGTVMKNSPLKKLKQRMGALADKIMGRDGKVGITPKPGDGKIGITPKPGDGKIGITPKPKNPEEYNLAALQGDNVAGMDHVGIYHEFANLSDDENIKATDNKIVDSKSVPAPVLIQDKTGKVEETFQKTPEAKKSIWKSIGTWVKDKRDYIKETAAQKKATKQALIDKRDRRRNATPAGEFIGIDGGEMPNFQLGENPRGKKEEIATPKQEKSTKLSQEQIEGNLYKNIDRL